MHQKRDIVYPFNVIPHLKIGKAVETFFENILDHKITKVVAIFGLVYWISPYIGINMSVFGNPIGIILIAIAFLYGITPIFTFLDKKVSNMLTLIKNIREIKKIKSDLKEIRGNLKNYNQDLIRLHSDIKSIEKELYGNKSFSILPSFLSSGSIRDLDGQMGLKNKIENIEKRLAKIEGKSDFIAHKY